MSAAIDLRDVTVWRPAAGGRVTILDGVDWHVARGERWGMLGPNGAGKTTLLNVVAAVTHPSGGSVTVLRARFGRTDMAALRARIGFVDPGVARSLAQGLTAEEVLLTGATATILLLADRVTGTDQARAAELLDLLGCAHLRGRAFGRCSQGERKRILLARALMRDPELLVLDEPTAGLDLPGREEFLRALDTLASTHPTLTTVVVTHHVEELPSSTTHALLLREGRIVATGPVEGTMTGAAFTACFGLPVVVTRADGRWHAVAA